MATPITVRDRTGKIVKRLDGVLLDGDTRHVPLMLADSAAGGPHRMTDAQRAVAQEGIRQALADHAARRGGQGQANAASAFGLTDAERDAAQGRRDARSAILQDAWKPPSMLTAEARNAGRSYEERMSSAWKDAR